MSQSVHTAGLHAHLRDRCRRRYSFSFPDILHVMPVLRRCYQALPAHHLRRIGTMHFGLYASHSWQEIPPENWVFIAYERSLEHIKQQNWLESLLDGRRVIFRASDLMAQQQAARSGLGLATLPYFMGDADSSLSKLTVDSRPLVRDIWLVAYPELRRDPSVAVVMEFLAGAISKACPPD